MITAAKPISLVQTPQAILASAPFSASTSLASNSGQSLIEFLIIFPVLVGFLMLTVHISTVIQMAIVNQKYARAQALYLSYHSPYYPALKWLPDELAAEGLGQIIMGVSDNLPSDEEDDFDGGFVPKASVRNIASATPLRDSGNNDPQAEPNERANVRVRNFVVLCTSPKIIRSDAGFARLSASTLNDATQFEYCRSNLE